MPAQFLLEVVLLGTLHPALAQAVGLYWTDTTAVPENAFDYLLLADDSGVAQLDPAKMLMLVRESGLANLDSYILFNKRAEPAPALAPPGDVRVFALPGSVIPVDDGGLADARNTVGLRWERNLSEQGVLLPGGAIMYHVWRAALGNGAAPSAPSNFALVTRDGPVLVTETTAVETPQRASDWPPFPMHAIDQALPDGWYSYQVSGIDLFGRHSANSPAGPWYQWTPPPEPRAWYYQDPPGDTVVHPFAVRLLVKTPPPRPSGIEAFALDPNDPLVVKDAAYSVWWEELRRAPWYIALPEDERRNLIGLRVRWLWTTAQMRQAPDTREFRIYYRSGHQNTLFGHAVSVATPSATESVVATDIANNQPADSYAEGWLRVGTDAFSIVASEAGSPLRLRVRNIGPHDTIRPRPNAPCTLAIPPAFSAGTVSVTNGSPTVTGRGTSWSSRLIGTMFRILGEPEDYRVATVASPTQLTLDRGYARSTDVGKHYALRNPLFVDYGVPTSWDQRFFVVGYDQYWTPGEDEEGQPLRRYEVFLPTRAGLVRGGLPLRPTLADPIAYGHIGVSAADDKPYTADHPKWAGGDWGGRPGNEGRVGPAATVFRVRREPPPAPQPPPLPGGADHAYATAADYQGRSFYTYRWQPTEHLKTHVLRALDDAVFKVDWTQRPRPPLDASQVQFFPKETIEPRWTSAKRQQVSDELNRLNTLTGDTAQAMAAYRALSNDAQRVLAGLPGNEAAFTQVTIEPLDPDDPANADRRGPDDPATYTPDPNLRACLDTLDGHSTNRYFYRALSVDAVHNRGESGLSSPPIVLPSFQRPQAPRLLRIVGGNRRITLTWAAPHEQDIDRFLVFRIAHADNGRDIRQMGAPVASLPALERIVHDGEVDLGAGTDIVIAERVYASAGFDPSKDLLDGQTAVQYLPNPTAPAGTRVTGLSAPDETAVVVVYRDSKDSVQYTAWKTQPVVWIDEGVTGPRTYFYRVVVTRQADVLGGSLTIVSAPSELGVGRAVDNTPPEPPEITVIEWVRIGTDGTVYPYTDPVPAGELRLPAVRLVWTSPDPDLSSMVQCAEEPGGRFANASGWLQRGVYELVHQNDRWFQEQTYRLKVLNLAGNTNTRYAPASLPQAT